MNRKLQVPQRMHQVNVRLEEMKLLRLAQAQRQAAAAREEWEQVREERRRALAARLRAPSGRDWWLWQLYAEALQAAGKRVGERVEGLEAAVEQGRKEVRAAHQEQLRWDVLLRQRRSQIAAERQRSEQRQLDEIGLQMRVQPGAGE
ncbi:flagellar FliJ family protein [Alicyclobacillus kakegawensis]|uniref:flagellar FliJ family protein n=1 Tax=Alicyclobacillus kakegawensis TaxID=392012 RepID=UPI000831B84C|nr:flagellar FliJ family protein [Alicyclobacillus kakegawensis]